MSSEASTRAYYDDFATTYERGRDHGYHALVDELEASTVIPLLPGKRVLEVGCGTGLVLAKLAPHAAKAVGVDLSPGMLALARERGLDVREGSATALPFDDGSFDVVCSFKVLAHVPAIEKALAEVGRVLAPGGVGVLEFYNRRSLRYLARLAAGARSIGRSHREDDIPTRWDTPATIAAAMPDSLRIHEFVGVRIVTPAALLYRAPMVGSGLAAAEKPRPRAPGQIRRISDRSRKKGLIPIIPGVALGRHPVYTTDVTEESGVDQLRRRAEQAIASDQGRRVIVPLLERLINVAPEGSPASLYAHRHLAEYRVEEHPWRALLSLRKVVAAQPDDDVVHALMGLAQALLSNFRAAVEAYRRALAIAPRNPWYHHNLGHLLDVALERPEQALRHLEIAHKATAPNDPEIAASLAHCLARIGKLDAARTLAAGAVAAAPRNADHRRLLEWIDRGAPAETKPAPAPARAPASSSSASGSASSSAVSPAQTGSGQTSSPTGPTLAVVAPSAPSVSASMGGTAVQTATQVGAAPVSQPVQSIPSARARASADLEAIDSADPVLPIIADAMREGGFTREHVARARRLWADYRETRGSWELLKPDVCAAALEYAIARLHGLDGVTRASVARRYGVSASAIADRFDDMQVVLALRPADPRYYTN